MKKINLEEILKKEIKKIYIDFTPSTEFCNRDRIIAKNAMKEACKQTLELAAENAYTKWNGDYIEIPIDTVVIDKQSIINTINQIE